MQALCDIGTAALAMPLLSNDNVFCSNFQSPSRRAWMGM